MKTKMFGMLLGVGLLACSTASLAEESKAHGPSPAALEQINLANKLIALGDARKDPLLLIAAAKLQKSLSAEPAGMPTASVTPQDVLARAKKLSAGQKDMAGLAADVEAMKSKGWDQYCQYCTSGDKAYYGIH
jgi:hypothetical protein